MSNTMYARRWFAVSAVCSHQQFVLSALFVCVAIDIVKEHVWHWLGQLCVWVSMCAACVCCVVELQCERDQPTLIDWHR